LLLFPAGAALERASLEALVIISRHWLKLAVVAALPLAACGRTQPDTSAPLVTDVDHTSVKRQSIGNCWLYAQATWLESLLLTETGKDVNVSESYWTYWNWYDQIVGRGVSEIQTGGQWTLSRSIIAKYGWVNEGDFVVGEATAEMSVTQAVALDAVNQALKPGGALERTAQRTAANVKKVLDKAWGASIDAAYAKRNTAEATIVGKDAAGNPIRLVDALVGNASQRWNVVGFPRLWGQGATPDAGTIAARKALLRRVFAALNDKKPVVMSLMIDFNAMDVADEGSFKKTTLDAAGFVGQQGGHMVVLEDYTVDNAPGFGTLGEGDLGDAAKKAALDGDLKYLKAKNSWGSNRPERGLTDGYSRFYADYLLSTLAWKNGEDAPATDVSYFTTLTDFTLPPGY
jgi:hypothetical protein